MVQEQVRETLLTEVETMGMMGMWGDLVIQVHAFVIGWVCHLN